MTARDLFTEEQNPSSGLGIPQSTVAKAPGAVGSIQPQAEARTPKEGMAPAEAPTETQTCGKCDHSRPGHNGLFSCALGSKFTVRSPNATCQMSPIQFVSITPERMAARAGSNNPPEKGHGSAAQSVSRNGGGGAETSAAGPALPDLDSRETNQYQIRDASMRAIWQLRADGKITERQKELLEFYAERPPGVSYTRQEIARQMMNRHGAKWAINQVCGRVNELIKLGRLVELPEYRKCNVTQENVNAIARGIW